jgi:hypothetical protein
MGRTGRRPHLAGHDVVIQPGLLHLLQAVGGGVLQLRHNGTITVAALHLRVVDES